MKAKFLSAVLGILLITTGNCQENELNNRNHFIGTSAFTLANLFPEPPSFFQLNYGYRFNKNVLSIEAITWKYHAPLGIPYGPSFESKDEFYPGYIREFGIGMAYQRFLWKNFYSAVHATPMFQNFISQENKKIEDGIQLFLALRFGYHLKLVKNKFFIEPSLAFTYWPVRTEAPESFAVKDRGWPNYFLFEPGMHCGIKF